MREKPAYRLRSCGYNSYAPRTDLLRAQAQFHSLACDKLARRANHLKTCPVPRAKIFRFRSHANHRHNSARLTADEGRWPSSRTRGEMRWTQRAATDVCARAYGEVVWFGRRGAGVKSERSEASLAGDGGKRAVLREEHEVSRKAIAQGRPECSRCPVCSCAVLFAQIARETAGAASTRSSLRPQFSKRANEDANLGRQRRENAKLHPPSLRAQRSNPSTPLAALWIASRSLSSGGASRRSDVARNDGRERWPRCVPLIRGSPRSGRLEGQVDRPGPPPGAWNPDPGPRNRPACLDFRQSDFPLVTES